MQSRIRIPIKGIGMSKPGVQTSRRACEQCTDRWCCTVQKAFPAPALTEAEFERLAEYTGRDDFAEMRPGGLHLKSKESGYCLFFDNERMRCGVYPARPFDCRMYPFDFIATPGGHWWIVYDCEYSQTLGEAEIWQALDDLENNYLDEIHQLWLRLDPYPDAADTYRLLRPVQCPPPPGMSKGGCGSD